MVGLDGLEPSTSRLSGVRSNHLSYRPTPSSMDAGDGACRGGERPSPPSAWIPGRHCRHRPVRGGTNRARPASRPSSFPAPSSRKRENSARPGTTPEVRPGIRRPSRSRTSCLPRKEVIQPHLPVRLPCYDLAPITGLTLGACPLTVGTATSGAADFRGLTGGVYKARERIHRCLLISDY